ncbi:hypothetical protein [Dyadobacter sp. CY312]|uniref:hypothetical protein n=1 Tax=Dyadobacter sp. CY312 TaxID=2907303 RepID=UPI001F364C73|nr:hypothetical protein [Dyadobacter sp. CY312]MCE7044346.1 hypothetical protein [Dyadobacter sp. CY312]
MNFKQALKRSTKETYTLIDRTLKGTNYHYLRHIDFDGELAYTHMRMTRFENTMSTGFKSGKFMKS